jgi:hypothetical protein
MLVMPSQQPAASQAGLAAQQLELANRRMFIPEHYQLSDPIPNEVIHQEGMDGGGTMYTAKSKVLT